MSSKIDRQYTNTRTTLLLMETKIIAADRLEKEEERREMIREGASRTDIN